jgi:P-loop containing dynein motor region D4
MPGLLSREETALLTSELAGSTVLQPLAAPMAASAAAPAAAAATASATAAAAGTVNTQQQQQPLTQEQLTSALTQRLRGHLHPVLCVSPHGPVLTTILQRYPALARHCSISWHGQWSDSSLVAAAQAVIGDCELAPLATTTANTINGMGGVPGGVPGGNGGSVTDALLGHMVTVYKAAQQQQQRKLSPASFLAYAHCYKAVWCEQLAAEERRGSSVAAALDKLKQAAHDVELLKVTATTI